MGGGERHHPPVDGGPPERGQVARMPGLLSGDESAHHYGAVHPAERLGCGTLVSQTSRGGRGVGHPFWQSRPPRRILVHDHPAGVSSPPDGFSPFHWTSAPLHQPALWLLPVPRDILLGDRRSGQGFQATGGGDGHPHPLLRRRLSRVWRQSGPDAAGVSYVRCAAL